MTRLTHSLFPVEGGCRCGKVRFRVTEPPLLEIACHCRGCQRMTASAFSTSIAVAEHAFAILAGETVRGGLADGEVYHHHCASCLSWVYTSFPPGLGFFNIRATLLDDPSWHAPWIEIEIRNKLPWAHTGAELSFESSPAVEDYAGFVSQYSAMRARAPLRRHARRLGHSPTCEDDEQPATI